MKRLILACLLCLVLSGSALAASSATISWENIGNDIDVATITWIAHTDGSFTNYTIPSGWYKGGCLYYVITDPGSPAPTADYDITVLNGTIDMAGGQLANRNTSTTEDVKITTIRCAEGSTPPVITISGNSQNGATGVIKLFFGR